MFGKRRVTPMKKLNEGRPNISDMMKNGQVQLIVNTPTKKGTVFRLYLSPQAPSAGSNRRYHIGGEGD